MKVKVQALILGAIFTAVTGISVFAKDSVLWAPGIVVAFFINGGGHEHNLSSAGYWLVVVVVNFLAYSAFSWILLLMVKRIRGKSSKLVAGS
ncbi:MAG TPA: hypothetical protein VFP71_11020 [Candidatus Angelobacter sp.]|nr:hypothetical protein [Candidatus Angelobacter sp.]